ncbi:cytochrome c biogenesis protein [Salinibius halmophilus]|uniref:cytochrome c biogenesis protein n=1 Tax=Salinibius halmophilus TaxID=1853216 RepID=UPI000E6653EB|nr:cytochrome c biogenesis protein [Salinibius halmophilus]
MWQRFKVWFHKWGSPRWFVEIGPGWQNSLLVIGLVGIAVGSIWGLAFAPYDFHEQGNSARIIYFHVPSAIIAQSLYMGMAIMGIVFLVWKIKMTIVFARQIVLVGMLFSALALATGGIWGLPTWGTMGLITDPRIFSTAAMFFLYVGIWVLNMALDDVKVADKATAVLAIVGSVNLPIIKFSVEWFNSLHQTATFTLTEPPKMLPEMWLPLLINVLAFYCFAGGVVLARARFEALRRERKKSWAQERINQLIGQ